MLKTVVLLLNIFVKTVMGLSYDFEALGSFHESVHTYVVESSKASKRIFVTKQPFA